MSASTIALIILFFTIVLFVTGKTPLAVTAAGAALAMGIFGIIPFETVFAGFANDVTMMVIGSMIIGEALFETGVAQKIGATIIRMVGTREKVFIVAVVVVTALLSALLSNTAVVAIMLPMIAATAASSGGAITKKNTFMAVGFAANAGGGMTLIGSTPNVVGQGLLSDAGLETMGFFDLTLGSIPRLLFIVLFYATVGCALQNKIFSFDEVIDEKLLEQSDSENARAYSSGKMIVATVILILTIAGFISGVWTVGAIAMTAALACILTGCISIKQVFERLDWTTVWVLAGSLGFAAGIAQSGAGQLIADTIIGLIGGEIGLIKLMVIFTIIAVILGNLMSSTATMALLGPIAISMCASLGLEAKPVFMAVIWSLNLAFLSPVATPPVTMTLQGGYRFLDYTKIGAILAAGCLILTVVMYPILF